MKKCKKNYKLVESYQKILYNVPILFIKEIFLKGVKLYDQRRTNTEASRNAD